MESNSEKARFSEKWGIEIDRSGFSAIPNLLLEHQRRLDLSTTEMCVLLQLLRFFWFKDRNPFPSIGHLERALPVQRRAIQRAISQLQKKGFVEKRKATRGLRPEYDLSGLRTRLMKFVPPQPGGSRG